MLELHAGKLARVVLGGRGGSNASLLPDLQDGALMDERREEARDAIRFRVGSGYDDADKVFGSDGRYEE